MPGINNWWGADNDPGTDLIDRAPEPKVNPQDAADAGHSFAAKAGAALAFGAALALAVGLAPLTAGVGTAIAIGTGVSANTAIIKGTEASAARSGEDAANRNQRETVDGLIAKGAGKDAGSRDAYFDKLAEMFPSEAKRIREQRAQQEAEAKESVTATETEVSRDERD